jgi:hypothetical protein
MSAELYAAKHMKIKCHAECYYLALYAECRYAVKIQLNDNQHNL